MTKLLTIVRQALRQVRAYPLESTLIVVALAVGVGALSAVAALYGVSDEITRRLRADLSAREFTILPATVDAYAELSEDQLAIPFEATHNIDLRFREEQMDELRQHAPAVDHVYFRVSRAFTTAAITGSLGPGSPPPSVISVTEDFQPAASVPLERGEWFSSAGHEEGRRVVVIRESETDLIRLGITGDPLGQELPMARSQGVAPYTVMGILDPEHELGDFAIGYVPYSPTHTERPDRFYAAVDDFGNLPEAAEQLRLAVERIWGGAALVQSPASLWQVTSAERNRALLLAGFASVGLLLASLNIANLMMARVRRREGSIAILRSVGASQGDIRRQVIAEAALLGLFGGVLGVVLMQLFLTSLVASAAPVVGDFADSVAFPPIAVVATVLVAVALTVLIGFAPAIGGGRTTAIVGAQASAAAFNSMLPRSFRRSPVRVVLSSLQVVVSAAAIVTALHVTVLGDSAMPETDHFYLKWDGLNQSFSSSHVFRFDQAGIERMLELSPAVLDLAEWFPNFGSGLMIVDDRQYAIRGLRMVGPSYMDMMGVTVVAGEPLDGRLLNPPGVLLEQSVAELVFGGSDAALGRELTMRRSQSASMPPPLTFQVVGVYNYDNQPSHPLATTERVPAIALVMPSYPFASREVLASAETPRSLEAREQLLAAASVVYGHRQDTVFQITEVSLNLVRQRQLIAQTTTIVTIMAIVAIALAAIGIVSLAVLETAERVREIGLKRALGASSGQIAFEVMGSTMVLATAAALAGIVAAWLAAPALSSALSQSLLSGLTVPLQWVLALATIGLIALISSCMGWLVGQRAARTDPVTALAE